MGNAREFIAPYCFGYLTQYWFGLNGPMPSTPSLQSINSNSHIAFESDLGSGIKVGILRNGLVRFDLSSYPDGGVIIYREEETRPGRWASRHPGNYEQRDHTNRYLAFRLIQVHAVLFDNARRAIERCSSHVARPASIDEMLSGYDLQDPIQQVVPGFKQWTPIRDDVARKSISDLRLAISNDQELLGLFELYAIASARHLEHRFSEALIIYWTVIEACIDALWRRLVADEAMSSDVRMPRSRRDRLGNSSTYSAAVRTEILYLRRKMPGDLYVQLNDVRSRRNKWMHELREIEDKEVVSARKVCESMFRQVFAFDLEGTMGGVGGAGGGISKYTFVKRYPQHAHYFGQ